MSFERFVAVRYFKAKRQGLFSLVTTVLGIAGVTIGVAALIATLSVMNGFQSDIETKVVGAQAHVTVHGEMDAAELRETEDALKGEPGVVAVSPFALGQAILTYKGRSTGAVLKGLDPDREFQVNELAKNLKEGSWAPIRATAPEPRKAGARPAEPPGIVLGQELARNLGAWVGEEVVIVSPQGLDTPLGLVPKMKKFRVAGLLHTGYYEFDASTAYAGLGEVSAFLGLKGASGLQARLKDLGEAEDTAARLQGRLGYGVAVRSYKDMNRTLFAALRLEKYVMFLILTLITLVASFNITSNLVMLGTEKLRDIGLLKAMGATPAQIRRIFLWAGLLFGACGVGAGLVLGLVLCWYIRHFSPVELPGDIYYLSKVPVNTDPRDVAVVVASGLALSVLSALYPAWRTGRARPVEAIRDA